MSGQQEIVFKEARSTPVDASSWTLFQVAPDAFQSIDILEGLLGYAFTDRKHLYEALTHRSSLYSNGRFQLSKETLSRRPWNERMEFLGDAVLGLVISKYLMTRMTHLSEGEMSRIRSSLVCEESLANLARSSLHLHDHLVLGPSELGSHGPSKKSLLADALEAVIGAVFVDGGYDLAEKVVLRIFEGTLKDSLSTDVTRDAKTTLQELAQSKFKSTPRYEVTEESGPAHKKCFEVSVIFAVGDSGEVEWGRGRGDSKKSASQAAANDALKKIDVMTLNADCSSWKQPKGCKAMPNAKELL